MQNRLILREQLKDVVDDSFGWHVTRLQGLDVGIIHETNLHSTLSLPPSYYRRNVESAMCTKLCL